MLYLKLIKLLLIQAKMCQRNVTNSTMGGIPENIPFIYAN